MLLHRLRVSGLLSFGPKGVDLPMEPLNVLIGPNGSGKSNFLEAMALLQAAPRDISEPIWRMGSVREWLWKGPEALDSFTMEVFIGYPPGGLVHHSMTIADRNGRPEVIDERLEPSEAHANERAALSYYCPPQEKRPRWNSRKPTRRQPDWTPRKGERSMNGRRRVWLRVIAPALSTLRATLSPINRFCHGLQRQVIQLFGI